MSYFKKVAAVLFAVGSYSIRYLSSRYGSRFFGVHLDSG